MAEQTHIELWQRCLAFIKDNLDGVLFDTWFKDIESFSFENSTLTLVVPSSFFVEQLEERFIKLLATAIKKVYGPGVNLYYRYFQVQNEPETAVNQLSTKPSPTILSQQTSFPANPFRTETVASFDPQLNPRYTFDNYCAGESNKIARAIGEAIGTNPNNKTFNPLFIFGSTGVGKTHLIQAIGIKIKESNPAARVLYVTSRLFESQYTAAVASKSTERYNSFFHFYQSLDVLIVDDIQEMAGKTGTQNTFFHIFNHLHQNNKQIILSSDCAPADMTGFEERMLSRFRWRMAAELQKPDLELRRKVLRMKAHQDGLDIPADVLEYIAQNVTDSIRELEGVVVSLMAHATVSGCDVDINLAHSVIERSVKINRRSINFEMVVQEVSGYYKIDPDLIFTATRRREVSDPRQIVMFLAKTVANMPIGIIGKKLGRTHATVNYACNAIAERIGVEKKLSSDIETIRQAILK